MKKLIFWILMFCVLGAINPLAAEPEHTHWTEIWQGSGDDGIVCYKQKHRNFFFLSIGLVGLAGLLLVNRFLIKKKLLKQLELKNKEISEKNKDITDSINYAKRIQNAILPAKRVFEKVFPSSFVIYQPRDIVSGDFFWTVEKGNKKYIAVADCTGHGVPGAMVSMVAHNLLERIVNEMKITSPEKILDQMNVLIKEILGAGENEVKDGLDITLCCYDPATKKLEFAGANHSIWISRSGELRKLEGDAQPIGHFDQMKPFSLQTEPMEPSDRLFLFTDGFADQFGGDAGKKLKSKNFAALLLETATLKLKEQEKKLTEFMQNWKKGFEQVDDITVVAIEMK